MINSDATALAASIRLGLRSSANILVDTSMASMMSIPSTDLFFHELLVCGRASTSTSRVNVAMRSNNCRGISLTRQLFGAYLNANVSLIRIVGSLFFLYITYHIK